MKTYIVELIMKEVNNERSHREEISKFDNNDTIKIDGVEYYSNLQRFQTQGLKTFNAESNEFDSVQAFRECIFYYNLNVMGLNPYNNFKLSKENLDSKENLKKGMESMDFHSLLFAKGDRINPMFTIKLTSIEVNPTYLLDSILAEFSRREEAREALKEDDLI